MPDKYIDLCLQGKQRGLSQPYPAILHLLDTAAMARVLWRDYLSPGLKSRLATILNLSEAGVSRLVEFIAGLHDVGKLTPAFQSDLGNRPGGYPADGHPGTHSHFGQVWLGIALQDMGMGRSAAMVVSDAVGGHHGCFSHLDTRYRNPSKLPYLGLGSGDWETQRRRTAQFLYELFEKPSVPAIPPAAATVITGMVILADWLASQSEYIEQRIFVAPETGTAEELTNFFSESVDLVPNELNKAGLTRLRLKSGGFDAEFGFRANTLQKSLATDLPSLANRAGLLMITAPMGIGKTEAALHAARILSRTAGSSGLYVALPTMATADQMFDRLQDYLEARSETTSPLALLHGMAWLSPVYAMMREPDIADPEVSSQEKDLLSQVTDWLRGAKKAVFAPAGVGTIDQALLSVLPVRHNVLRLLGLLNKTVVIDEAHAYDPYMRRLVCRLLEWLGYWGVPVVLMSATLPQRAADEFASSYLRLTKNEQKNFHVDMNYPGWTYVDGETGPMKPRDVDIDRTLLKVTLREVASDESGTVDRMPALGAELLPLLDDGGCAAVICTTVAEAQQTYEKLRDWLFDRPDVDVILLHSRFPAWQRTNITRRVVKQFGKNGDRKRRSIVVSTQVIEQSLDIDMDVVISDLAPFELLLQRAGRGHRHRENDSGRPSWAKRPRLVVLTAAGGDSPQVPMRWRYVYPHATLIAAQRLLRRVASEGVEIPGQVQHLVNRSHQDESLLVGFENAKTEREADAMVRRMQAASVQVPSPDSLKALRELSEQAIDDEAVSTRFDADSERVLPVFVDEEGDRWLDAARTKPLLERKPASGRDGFEQRTSIMNHTIALRASYLNDLTAAHQPPEAWVEDRYLKRLVLLPFQLVEDGNAAIARVGTRRFRLDPELGLVT